MANNIGRFTHLPYDIFEIILRMLNGREFTSVSCVCKSWHDMCEMFMKHRNIDKYWHNRCLKDIDWDLLHDCMAGKLYA